MSTSEEKAMNIWFVVMGLVAAIAALISWAFGIPMDVVIHKILDVMQKMSQQ